MKNKIANLVSGFDLQAKFRDWFYLTTGALLLIITVDVFFAPVNLSPGGVTGIAIIINEFTGWPVGLLMLLLNIPMMFIGFQHLGGFRFLTSTLYVVLLYNLGVDYATRWLPAGITEDLLLNGLYGAILGGIGMGLIYRGRGTSAGTGVLGRVLQLKTGIPLSQVYLLTDGGVILAAGMVFGWEIALYSLLTLFVWGLATDYILEGPSVIRTAFIVTDSPEDLSQAVFDELGLGVTAWTGQGMFTTAQHSVLFCTVSRPDVNALQELISSVDPHAFVVIGHGHQAKGGVLRQARAVVKSERQIKKLAA